MSSLLGPVQLERAARVVAECAFMTVPDVARKHAISKGTVRNYLAREARDEAFAQLCAKKREALQVELVRRDSDWVDAAVKTLRNSFAALDTLIQASLPKNGERPEKGTIREVAGAVKIVGELQVVRAALSGEHPRTAGQGPAAEEATGDPGGSGSEGVH